MAVTDGKCYFGHAFEPIEVGSGDVAFYDMRIVKPGQSREDAVSRVCCHQCAMAVKNPGEVSFHEDARPDPEEIADLKQQVEAPGAKVLPRRVLVDGPGHDPGGGTSGRPATPLTPEDNRARVDELVQMLKEEHARQTADSKRPEL